MSANGAAVSILRRSGVPRPYLVSVRAGAGSRRRDWFKPDEPRRWDLMLNWYDPAAEAADEDAEIVVAGGLSKLSAVKAVHDAAPGLLAAYRALLLLDDDILLAFADLDRLFAIVEKAELDLAQPALTHDSFHTWTVTLACPSFHLRYTNFVEIMMPLFSRSAFLACVDSFDHSISGYGLDFLWAKLLGYPRGRIAVVDAVKATHTRPIDRSGGRFYSYLRSIGIDPEAEWETLVARHALTPVRQEVLGVVIRTPRGLVRILFDPQPAAP